VNKVRPIEDLSVKTAPPEEEGLDFICWNEEYMAAGVAIIDEEHRQVVRDLNQLCRAHRAGLDRDDIRKILKVLCHFVQNHFKHEEAVLFERKCPTRDEHRIANAKFLKHFQEMVVEFSLVQDADQTAGEIENIVARWLSAHIYQVVASLRDCPALPPAEPGSEAGHNGGAASPPAL
jgi:hemerythrin